MKRDSKSCKIIIARQDQVHAQLKMALTSESKKFWDRILICNPVNLPSFTSKRFSNPPNL